MSDPLQVLVVPAELLGILQGHPTTCSTLGGDPVVVRLATAAEYRHLHELGRAYVGLLGAPVPPAMTDDQIADIVRPLNL
ncbi:hypothetical protein [Actinocorallia longicatena]|uniref:Prevent-host-death family protein n=1 Tax=Actinocorallia longicatena TaxID=111803 RepID=A0ABP6QHH3_9ACTN